MTADDNEANLALKSMEPMFDEARSKGLWFFNAYQQLWFSPTELESQNKRGKFLWGACNWQLRNPEEGLMSLDKKIVGAQQERNLFAARIKENR